MMRDLTFEVESKKYKPHSLWKLKYALGNFKQTKEMSLASYNLKFCQQVDVLRSLGGAIGADPAMVEDELVAMGTTSGGPTTPATPPVHGPTKAEMDTAVRRADNRMLTLIFVTNAYAPRYGEI